jgi:hypothetical protein
MSVIGTNALFPNPADRGSQAVDAHVITRFVEALDSIAKPLSHAYSTQTSLAPEDRAANLFGPLMLFRRKGSESRVECPLRAF